MRKTIGDRLTVPAALICFGFLFVTLFLSSSASAQDYFGAIAFGTQNGAYGYSYNYSDRNQAEQKAISQCQDHGGNGCQVAVWFRNACGALARSGTTGYGSGWGSNRNLAEQYAMESCGKHNSSCSIVEVVCTDR